jgi:hypothetical protein
MSAAETHRVQDRVATVTPLRHPASVPDTTPAAPAVPAPIRRDIDWRGLVQPPDIWSDDRPSLRKIWLYGVYGKWTNIDGVWRILGAVYASVIALPVHCAAYSALWLVERFPRLLVAAVLVTLVLLVLKH